MVDYINISSSIDFIKYHGGICVLDTQQDSSMDFGLKDSIYQNVFVNVDAYEGLESAFLGDSLKEAFRIILIPSGIDQVLLYHHKEVIAKFLDKGGILLSFAQNYREWLPGNSLYQVSQTPLKNRKILTCKHPITMGVRDYDITYRRGVCGFFSRGYFNPPKNAEIFLKDNADCCVGYIDRDSTNGVILSTAGADLFGYGLFEQSTAKRLGLNLLIYLAEIVKERC